MMGTPNCAACRTRALRRSRLSVRPVGFWKFGSAYRKRAPSASSAVIASGTRPPSSVGIGTYFGWYRLNDCSAPR
ncbi:Uncharacterised protein [Bordetella pertussis]|nr:Uncharacterised protein [Bordetella pertussis]